MQDGGGLFSTVPVEIRVIGPSPEAANNVRYSLRVSVEMFTNHARIMSVYWGVEGGGSTWTMNC